MTTAPTVPGIDVDFDQEVLRRVRQLHKVVVLDWQCHSFDDVEQALCRVIPAMTRPKAHAHAWEIPTSGASVVATLPGAGRALRHAAESVRAAYDRRARRLNQLARPR